VATELHIVTKGLSTEAQTERESLEQVHSKQEITGEIEAIDNTGSVNDV